MTLSCCHPAETTISKSKWPIIALVLALSVGVLMTAAWSDVSVSPGEADFDGSGRMDFEDFLQFVTVFGKSTSDPGFDGRADLDGSGEIDFSDFLLFVGVFGQAVAVSGEEGAYTDRFVFVSRHLLSDSHVDEIRAIIDTASANGLNGVVLSAGWDQADLRPPEFWDRVATVKSYGESKGVEIIPLGFSAGYGGGVLAHNNNLAAGLPLVGSYYNITGRTGQFLPDPSVTITNGDFEQFQGDTAVGYNFHDKPGQVSFADHTIVHSGTGSIRFENVGVHNR